MKISKAEVWLSSMRLTEPYSIAYQSADTATNVFLRLETSTGLVGFGCGAPDFEVTGETPEGVLSFLKDNIEIALVGSDPFRWNALLVEWESFSVSFPSALHAVNMALLDLIGKAAKEPLWKLLGGFQNKIPTSVTVGILPEKETVERARNWVGQGFSILKLKGGNDWESDVSRVRKVREAVGKNVLLRFDANQGYSADQAIRFFKSVETVGLDCFEQPTKARDLEALSKVSADTDGKVMADESLLTAKDALNMIQKKICPLFNVKLTKVGGIKAAEEILSLARVGGIGVMVGCMDESALGISAGLSLALSSPTVRFADLDGHIGLIGDPFANAIRVEEGTLIPSDLPGWGYEI